MNGIAHLFVTKARAGQPWYYLNTPQGYFRVTDDNAGPCAWIYRKPYKTNKRELRKMIAAAFANDRRDGVSPKVCGKYPEYFLEWSN